MSEHVPGPPALEGLAAEAARLGAALVADPGSDAANGVRAQLSRESPAGADGRLTWLVDLDGGADGAFSVAAVIDGEVVAAAVADVKASELFSAHREGGARRDGQAITVASPRALAAAHVATGPLARAAPRDAAVAHRVRSLSGSLSASGPPALAICWVACGRLDAYFARAVRRGVSAATLIAEEAGAQTELACPENEELVVVATPALWPTLRTAVEIS